MHALLHELLEKQISLTQTSDLDHTNAGNLNARLMGLVRDTLEEDPTGV
jgi:hypothetical protein